MRIFAVFLFSAIGIFIIDQSIKTLFLEGYYRQGSCIDLVLHMNKGVAFSLFAFLGDALKWVQLILIGGVLYYLLHGGYLRRYALPSGLLIGGAMGNLYDRFVHGAVVDYVAWHCGFDFAVFNFADVSIDAGIVLMLAMAYFSSKSAER